MYSLHKGFILFYCTKVLCCIIFSKENGKWVLFNHIFVCEHVCLTFLEDIRCILLKSRDWRLHSSEGLVFYLSPVVLEHNHAGLWVHPFQDQRLPVTVSIGNHRGHHGDRIACGLNHVIGRTGRAFLAAHWALPKPEKER